MAALSDAIQEYLDSRRVEGYKPNTIVNSRVRLNQFLGAVGNIQVKNVGPRQIDMWLTQQSYFSAATYNHALADLNCFFEWCRLRRYMPQSHNPLAGRRRRPVPKRPHYFVPPERFGELKDAASDDRDRFIVALGLHTFMRASEMRGVQAQHVHIDDDNPKKWHIQVWKPKVSDYDEIPVSAELAKEVRRWRLTYANQVGSPVEPDWHMIPAYHRALFVKGARGVQGPRMLNPLKSYERCAEAVQRALEGIGVEQTLREGIHTLRRSGARALYDEMVWKRGLVREGALEVVQSMLGHSSVQTTEHYLQLTLERKRRNDLIAGEQMFAEPEGQVIDLGQASG